MRKRRDRQHGAGGAHEPSESRGWASLALALAGTILGCVGAPEGETGELIAAGAADAAVAAEEDAAAATPRVEQEPRSLERLSVTMSYGGCNRGPLAGEGPRLRGACWVTVGVHSNGLLELEDSEGRLSFEADNLEFAAIEAIADSDGFVALARCAESGSDGADGVTDVAYQWRGERAEEFHVAEGCVDDAPASEAFQRLIAAVRTLWHLHAMCTAEESGTEAMRAICFLCDGMCNSGGSSTSGDAGAPM